MAQLLAANHYLEGRFQAFSGIEHTPITGTPSFSIDVNALKFSPDGSRLAIGLYYDTGRVRVYNTGDWSVVPGTPVVGGNSVWAFAWSADGSKLAVGYDAPPYYRVFNTADWSEISGLPTIPTLVAHYSARVNSISFFPDGERIALSYQGAGSSKFIDVINVTSKTLVSGTPSVAEYAWTSALSPDGMYFAITSQGCEVFETTGWSQVYASPSTNVAGIGWNPNSTEFVFGDNEAGVLAKISTASWSQVGNVSVVGDTWVLAYSPSGEKLYRGAASALSVFDVTSMIEEGSVGSSGSCDAVDVVEIPDPVPLLLDASSVASADLQAINLLVRVMDVPAAATVNLDEVLIFVRSVDAAAVVVVELLPQVDYLLRLDACARVKVALAPIGAGTNTLAFSLESGGTTRYEGFDFNSYAKIGANYYGCKSDGIYRLDGDTDAGEPIRSMVSFGKQDFGTSALKRITNAYVGTSGEGKLFLKIIAEGEEYIYAARSYDEHLQVQRFDTGKGLRTNWLEFELYNADGEDFELASVEFAAVPTSRRI